MSFTPGFHRQAGSVSERLSDYISITQLINEFESRSKWLSKVDLGFTGLKLILSFKKIFWEELRNFSLCYEVSPSCQSWSQTPKIKQSFCLRLLSSWDYRCHQLLWNILEKYIIWQESECLFRMREEGVQKAIEPLCRLSPMHTTLSLLSVEFPKDLYFGTIEITCLSQISSFYKRRFGSCWWN